jgi:hypothetical protein
MPENEPLLLIRPHPGRQEGAQGYLLRLAEANCMSVADLTRLGVTFDRPSLTSFQLLPNPALDPDLHAHVDRVAGWWAGKKRVWNVRHSRFCPCCLQQDASWKASWELYFHDVCPEHGGWLVDRCSSCGEGLSWQRDSLLRCSCGADLRFEAVQAAPQGLRMLSQRLAEGLYDQRNQSTPPLAALDIEQTQRLIRYLGGYLNPQAGRKPLKLRNAGRMDSSWPVTSMAAALLQDWPVGFQAALGKLQESASGTETRLNGVFGYGYHYLYKGLPERVFSPLREAFEMWMADHWKSGATKRNRRLPAELLKNARWIHGSLAAKQIGISLARLRYFVQQGAIEGQESVTAKGRKLLLVRQDQLATLQTEVAREMTMTEAMALLGLGKVRMQRILRLLFPSARRVNDNSRLPWCVPRNEVEPLLALAADLPVVTIPEEHQVSLAHVLQFWMWSGEELVALVESVKAGALQPASQLADARGISRWIFDIAALRALQQRIRSGNTHWISIPDLAIRLNIKQQVAYWLIFHGYIHAEKVGAGKGRGSMVSRDELLRFQKRFVLGREIAARLGCSPRKVMHLLQEQGIDPLRGHEGEPCRQLVYANSERIQAFLDQYAGSAAEDFRLVREQGQPPPGGRIIETDENFSAENPKSVS